MTAADKSWCWWGTVRTWLTLLLGVCGRSLRVHKDVSVCVKKCKRVKSIAHEGVCVYMCMCMSKGGGGSESKEKRRDREGEDRQDNETQ